MEDKTFELMAKMYAEMKQGFANIDNKFTAMDSKFAAMENKIENLSKQGMDLENDLKPKTEAALDGYKLVYEKLTELSEKVDIISSKVEKQDVDIRVIKGVK